MSEKVTREDRRVEETRIVGNKRGEKRRKQEKNRRGGNEERR